MTSSHQVETDDNQTRLELARAYIDMGDTDGSQSLLQEVIQAGTEAQAGEARVLLAGLGVTVPAPGHVLVKKASAVGKTETVAIEIISQGALDL